MTVHSRGRKRPLVRTKVSAARSAALCLICVVLLAVAGCTGAPGTGTGDGSASSTVGANMAGPVVDVNVTPEALASKPKAWVLTTPESAVRSYLDWTSYAYRIGQSVAAKATMSADEEVHVDSYVQYNLQKMRLIEQTLDSITFGTPSVGSTSTLVPAKEQWTYSYISIDPGNRVIGGPYKASYDAIYSVVKTEDGVWVVDSVDAKALGTVE